MTFVGGEVLQASVNVKGVCYRIDLYRAYDGWHVWLGERGGEAFSVTPDEEFLDESKALQWWNGIIQLYLAARRKG